MKKSILAAAMATALVLPVAQADTILYGSARVSIDYTKEDSFRDKPIPFDGKGNWDVVNNDSRLGVQGIEDLGGGLSAVYKYEFGVDMTEGGNWEGNRPKFVGLRGGFGTITAGTQETPYYKVVEVVDIFNSSKTFGPTAFLGGSFGYKINEETDTRNGAASLVRLDNTVLYVSPEFSGFSMSAMLSMSGADGKQQGWSDGIDIWNINAKYVNGPFYAGVTYVAANGSKYTPNKDIKILLDNDLDQWAVGLGYSNDALSIGLIYERGTYNEWGHIFGPNWKIDKPWNAYLAGSYSFGNNLISAAYGRLDNGLPNNDAMDNYILGYQYNFSKRTSIWAEYIGRSTKHARIEDGEILQRTGNPFYGDSNAISIGTRHDF